MSTGPQYKPPASLRGVSLSEINAQRKADEDLKSILSARKGNPVAAFAQGLAAGAAVPMVMSVMPIVGSQQAILDDASDRAALASLIKKEMGVPKALAHRHAAAAHQFLKRSRGLSLNPGVEDALRGVSGTPISVQTASGVMVYDSEADLLKTLQAQYAKSGVKDPGAVAKSHLTNAKNSGQARFLHDASVSHAIFPSQGRANKIMEEAYKAFEAGGEKLPDAVDVLGREVLKRLKKAGPSALVLGMPAGFAAVKLQQKRRKELQTLRQERNRRLAQMGFAPKKSTKRKKKSKGMRKTAEDVLDAAPGLAAVPGFAIGYSSPEFFNPKALFPSMAPETLKSPKGRVLSGLLGAATMGSVASLPAAVRNTYRALVPAGQRKAEDAPMVIQKRAASSCKSSRTVAHAARTAGKAAVAGGGLRGTRSRLSPSGKKK